MPIVSEAEHHSGPVTQQLHQHSGGGSGGSDTTEPSDDEGLSSSLESLRRARLQQRGQLLQRLDEAMQLRKTHEAYGGRGKVRQQTSQRANGSQRSGSHHHRHHARDDDNGDTASDMDSRDTSLQSSRRSSRSSLSSAMSDLDESFRGSTRNHSSSRHRHRPHSGPARTATRGTRGSISSRNVTRSPYAVPPMRVHVASPGHWARPRSGRSNHSAASSRATSAEPPRHRHPRRHVRRDRPLSGASVNSSFSSVASSTTSSVRSTQPRVYQKRAHTCRFIAYRNGDPQVAHRVVGASMAELLDACTRKLGLPFAARRLFDEHGREMVTTEECSMLPGDAIVYVSCGEPFVDPVAAQQATRRRFTSTAAANRTIAFTPNITKALTTLRGSSTTPVSSLAGSFRARAPDITASARTRVVLFENGDGLHHHTIPLRDHDTFVRDCSRQFVLTSQVERFFDLDGNETRDLAAAEDCGPELHLIFGRIRGPYWIATKTDVFKPEGPLNFIQHQLHRLQRQHTALQDELQRVTTIDRIVESEQTDSNQALLDQITAAIKFLKRKQRHLTDVQMDGSASRIRPISDDHRLLAAGSLKLIVHANGTDGTGQPLYFNLREAQRTGDAETMMGLLLAACTTQLGFTQSAKRIFLKGGKVLRDLHALENDTHIWVSCGEPFTPANLTVVKLAFDGVETVVVDGKRQLLAGGGAVDMNTLSSAHLSALSSLTEALACDDVAWRPHDMMPGDTALEDPNLVTLHATLEDDHSLLFTPSLVRGPRQHGAPLMQRWVLRQVTDVSHLDGVDANTTWAEITSRAFPALALVCHQTTTDAAAASGGCVAGGDDAAARDAAQKSGVAYRVGLGARTTPPSREMLWHFAPDGTIRSAVNPALALTLAGKDDGSSSSSGSGGGGGGGDGESPLNSTSSSDAGGFFDDVGGSSGGGDVLMLQEVHTGSGRRAKRRQQWGLKHDSIQHMGQWKACRGVNGSRSWVKNCMLWPTATTGNWNTDLLWPMDVLLVPTVAWKPPPAKRGRKRETLHESMERMRGGRGSSSASITDTVMTMPRLRVVRNGTRMRPVEVLVPEGLRAREHRPELDLNRAFPVDTQKWFEQRLGPGWRTILTSRENPRDAAKMRELQVQLFLDRCTRALGMSMPARALFTEQGDAVTDLEQLQPNQVLLVTCGEAWVPPPSVLQRLPNLEADMRNMRAVADMFASQDAVVVVFDTAGETCLLREKGNILQQLEAAQHSGDSGDSNNDDHDGNNSDTESSSHGGGGGGGGGGGLEDAHAAWMLTPDRHLVPVGDRSHCLAPQALKAGAELQLVPVDTRDATQKWVMEGAFLQSAMDATLVLTVPELGRQGTSLALATKAPEPFYAHQCWELCPAPGGGHLLQAYACSSTVFACSIGRQCSMCTFAMTEGTPIKQAGFVLEDVEGTCCAVCAAMSKHKATARPVGVSTFACAFCSSQRELCQRLGTNGPRASLVSQHIILAAKTNMASAEQVEDAISRWDKCLAHFQAREETARGISHPAAPSARLDPGVQFRARVFRNGHVDPANAVIIVAPRADAHAQLGLFLSDATSRLNLPSAARVLYTRTGTALQSLSPEQHSELQRGGDGAIPDLWVSMGEPFSPPDQHPETIARRKKELKQELVQLKTLIAEKKQTLKSLSDKLQGALSSTERSTVDDRRDVVRREIEEDMEAFKANREELRALKSRAGRDSKGGSGGGGGGGSTGMSNELIARLSKPVSRRVRVQARKNGSSKSAPVLCMGDSMTALLTACASNLGMRRARKLYTMQGERIKSLDAITRDMEVLVSSGEAFIDDNAKKDEEQTRASFGRAIRAERKRTKSSSSSSSSVAPST
ncbi:hypothetical protein PTSG_02099 [Salpingoeca rosetta]|uniref:Doublecortin domain-containing protein n=1 Tax=Salpingoeca rosetta (strain ATCC 50818 / BSB-021) TaxID=946362 RepID=F2U2M5_SALR5|nr:uncharacterized protein PTSG_02099 [Salpingoeca rosetta]EGD81380.1 hypothetical protein PTSG_02099 [Salpingoeca rosetta]|eukprot:XP_004996584.1 hypothetical protein PTSG_02099 [Salpingoeca rosetta]